MAKMSFVTILGLLRWHMCEEVTVKLNLVTERWNEKVSDFINITINGAKKYKNVFLFDVLQKPRDEAGNIVSD